MSIKDSSIIVKDKEREELKKAMAEFIAQGGTIKTYLESGSADVYIRPASHPYHGKKALNWRQYPTAAKNSSR